MASIAILQAWNEEGQYMPQAYVKQLTEKLIIAKLDLSIPIWSLQATKD